MVGQLSTSNIDSNSGGFLPSFPDSYQPERICAIPLIVTADIQPDPIQSI